MKKFSKFLTALIIVTGVMFLPVIVNAYEIDKTYQLAPNEGSSRVALNKYIVIHDTANPNATGQNEAIFMKRNWQIAYTQYIVGDAKVYQVGIPGYVAWGALNANPAAPVQIELQATPDKNLFKQNYAIYIELIRDSANNYGIPLTLDGVGNGVKSHLWVSQNLGGDHTDPYGYLASMGISKEQLAKDIANGIDSQTEVKPDPNAQTYKVVGGDTLIKIGNRVNVKWQTLADTNNLKSPYLLSVGQTLVVKTNAETPNTNKPEPSKPSETGWVAETGTFYPNTTINVRTGASTNHTAVAQYHNGESVTYDSYKVSGGYVWIHYTSYSGQDRYMAIRPQGGSLWGNIK